MTNPVHLCIAEVRSLLNAKDDLLDVLDVLIRDGYIERYLVGNDRVLVWVNPKASVEARFAISAMTEPLNEEKLCSASRRPGRLKNRKSSRA